MPDAETVIAERTSEESLILGGVAGACGIIAGTDNDAENLRVVLKARELQPEIFAVVRQNHHPRQVLFNAAKADLIMQSSLVAARRILFLLIAPLLKTFFQEVRRRAAEEDDAYIETIVARLREAIGDERPRLWTLEDMPRQAVALHRLIEAGERVTLRHVTGDPTDRDRAIGGVALVIRNGAEVTVMPGPEQVLRAGDEILFCCTTGAHRVLEASLNNEYTLAYLVSGEDPIRSTLLRWLLGREPHPLVGRR